MSALAFDGLQRVFGRITRYRLAQKLGISRVAVGKWAGVPIRRVHDVAEATGLAPHEIRPDLPKIFPRPPAGHGEGATTPSVTDRPFGCPPD